MTMRGFAKAVLPPVVVRAMRRLLSQSGAPDESSVVRAGLPEWQYIPEGWSYADTHPEVRGWNVEAILSVYERKWARFVELARGVGPLGISHESDLVNDENLADHNIIMSFAYAIALAAHQREKLSFLDWGGGIGHYCVLAQSLLPSVEIEYHCKDVPLMVQRGLELFPDQHFCSDGACLDREYDFVMASSSLHYERDWKALLGRLSAATARWLFVTRLPVVWSAPSYVFLQRPYKYGYGTEYLAWSFNRDEFLGIASQSGLELVREFVLGERPAITGAPENWQGWGFLFQKENGSG